jgi:ribonuclease VapC
MFIDASAMIAIIAEEPDGPALAARLEHARRACTSPLALYEAILGLARRSRLSIDQATDAVDQFVDQTGTEISPITAEIGRGAVLAFERYGRGRHPAQLNMGDCFAYACARALDVPLLFKGDDFSQTDIATG